jgi:hypothetical protein
MVASASLEEDYLLEALRASSIKSSGVRKGSYVGSKRTWH